MNDVTVKTNNVPRPIIYWYDLTENEQAEFDYLDTEEKREWSRFVRYKNWVYDLGDMMGINSNECFPPQFKKWHCYASDTFFSGVLFRLCEDVESVICATYYS